MDAPDSKLWQRLLFFTFIPLERKREGKRRKGGKGGREGRRGRFHCPFVVIFLLSNQPLNVQTNKQS